MTSTCGPSSASLRVLRSRAISLEVQSEFEAPPHVVSAILCLLPPGYAGKLYAHILGGTDVFYRKDWQQFALVHSKHTPVLVRMSDLWAIMVPEDIHQPTVLTESAAAFHGLKQIVYLDGHLNLEPSYCFDNDIILVIRADEVLGSAIRKRTGMRLASGQRSVSEENIQKPAEKHKSDAEHFIPAVVQTKVGSFEVLDSDDPEVR